MLLMFATVINYMDRMAMNQMAEQIQDAFELNNEQYSNLETAFSIAFGVGAICFGWVVDRVSVRWVYPFVVFGWSCAGVLTGFSNSFTMLLTCRFLLGIFEAGNWPSGLRTTRAMLTPRDRSLGNALFQSGTALGAVMTPQLVKLIFKWAEVHGETDMWRFPFRLIGSVGLLWIVLWFLTVPRRMVQTVGKDAIPTPQHGATRDLQIFADIRFWVLMVLVVAVNIPWHGYRTWLPLYLKKQRGYSFEEMSDFTTFYYLFADIGAWTVGLTALGMCRLGVGLHTSRVIGFGACALLALTTFAVPFLPNGWPLELALLAVGFSALGLFPTYYALTQEISSTHQGKVTGTLGLVAHLSLAGIYNVEGKVCDWTHSYDWVMGGVGVFPFLAFCVLLVLWKAPREGPP